MAKTALAQEDIAAAQKAVANYRATCQVVMGKIQTDLSGLIGVNFVGDAATEYMNFYDQVRDGVDKNILGEDGSSITAMLDKILTEAVPKLLDPTDTGLANANKNAAN